MCSFRRNDQGAGIALPCCGGNVRALNLWRGVSPGLNSRCVDRLSPCHSCQEKQSQYAHAAPPSLIARDYHGLAARMLPFKPGLSDRARVSEYFPLQCFRRGRVQALADQDRIAFFVDDDRALLGIPNMTAEHQAG